MAITIKTPSNLKLWAQVKRHLQGAVYEWSIEEGYLVEKLASIEDLKALVALLGPDHFGNSYGYPITTNQCLAYGDVPGTHHQVWVTFDNSWSSRVELADGSGTIGQKVYFTPQPEQPMFGKDSLLAGSPYPFSKP
jgi:hypothetical protein